MTDRQQETADLFWSAQGAPPRSVRFGDVYFSAHSGLEESRAVFLAGCGLPEGWRGQSAITILETGFGTGLNFLATWQAWRADAQACARLHFVSVEAFPVTRADMVRALSAFAELDDLTAALAEAYPQAGPSAGVHRWSFEDGAVTLTLHVGEAAAMLTPAQLAADAVYLDGFAPAKNPEMWRPEVLGAVASCARAGARLATFTVARAVRDGLEDAGFAVHRVPGFGSKRHRLEATLDRVPENADPAPFYAPGRAVGTGVAAGSTTGPIAVIGAGIAGAALARALVRRGREVVVIDAAEEPGGGASGNPAAAVFPRPTVDPAHTPGRFHAHCWRFFHQWVRDLPPGLWAGTGGVVRAGDADAAARLQTLETSPLLAPGEALFHEAAALAELTGLPATAFEHGGLHVAGAGALAAAATCRALLTDVPGQYGAGVSSLRQEGAGWRVVAGDREIAAGTVVIAAAMGAAALVPQAALPLTARRGQITAVSGRGVPPAPRAAISAKGYVLPVPAGLDAGEGWLTGATFDHVAALPDPGVPLPVVAEDHARNLARLSRDLPGWVDEAEIDPEDALQRVWGRASLRATTPDRLPMAGPLYDAAVFATAYDRLRHGPTFDPLPPPPYLPGLYLLGGLGSHGFLTAPLLAELLASELCGDPAPLPEDLIHAVRPARFVLRALRKNQHTGE